MTTEPITTGSRKHFEGLLQDCMKHQCRKPLAAGERAAPEVYTTFREGFKCALIMLGLVKKSTTELNDKQMQILMTAMERHLGITPPPPDHP